MDQSRVGRAKVGFPLDQADTNFALIIQYKGKHMISTIAIQKSENQSPIVDC
jgi:hypothetical protein